VCQRPECFNIRVKSENLQRQVYKLRKKNTQLCIENKRLQETYTSMFNPDQIEKIMKGRVSSWTKETMEEAVNLKYAAGTSGYDILSQKFPLPSATSLGRRVQKIPLAPGINTFIIDKMREKGIKMNKIHKICNLSLDEMELKEALEYDKGQQSIIGYCTMGDTEVRSNKLLALVARGITLKWKQVIGWHFTSDKKSKSPTGKELLEFVYQGVKELENAGYEVCGVTSDMGSSNQAMWREAGLKIGCDIAPSAKKFMVRNPVRKDEKFVFMADVPHLLKALKNAFTKYDFLIPNSVVQENNLPTNIATIKHIRSLLDAKGEAVFVAASHIEDYMLNSDSFEKMKVGPARAVFCEKTVTALQLGVKKGILPNEALTTAWFVSQVATWFTILTSRNRKTSITRRNAQFKLKFLESFIELFKNISNTTGKHKPYQTGIVLTTTCIITIVVILLNDLTFVLIGRFTQDVVENLFSIVRYRGGRTPSPLQGLRALRLIMVAQFTKQIKRGNYECSTDKNHLEFLSSPVKKKKFTYPEEEIQQLALAQKAIKPAEMFQFAKLGVLEEDILSEFAGYIVRKIKHLICMNCKDFLIDESGHHEHKSTHLELRNKGGMISASEQACIATKILELRSKEKMKRLLNHKNLLHVLTIDAVSLLEGDIFPSCTCKMAWHFSHFFFKCRCYFYLRKVNKDIKRSKRHIYSSKTAHLASKK
jgi:hypothetical protein